MAQGAQILDVKYDTGKDRFFIADNDDIPAGTIVTAKVDSVSGGLEGDAGGVEIALYKRGVTPFAENTLAVVGDSFSARWRVASAGAVDYRPQGFLMWALAYSGQRMTVISDQSVGGAYVSNGGSVTPMVVQIDAAIASGARNLLLTGGINDIGAGVAFSVIKAAFSEIVAKAQAAGMRIFWCLQPQLNSAAAAYSVARQGTFFKLNDYIRSLATSPGQMESDIVVIDGCAAMIDPASATGNWKSGYAQSDNLHPTNVGAMALGKAIAAAWSTVPAAPLLLTSAADNRAYSVESTNILSNGLFTAGTTVGTGWTQTVTGSGACTPSLLARADGFGNDQQLVCTFSANNDSAVLTSSDVKAGIALGDSVTASCELNLSSMTATRCIRVQLAMVGSLGSKTMSWGQLDSSVDVAMTDATGVITVKLEPVVYTEDLGTLTSVTLAIRAFGTGTGGVTVKAGRAAIRKLVTIS